MDWVTFGLKLVLVPTFIGIVSLAGRRWGPTVGGWLIGLPFTSAPVAFFLALEQGRLFASEASLAIMVGIISVFVFSVVYSWVAMHRGWLLSMLAGFFAYFACTYLLDMVNEPPLMGFVIVILVLVASIILMPRVGSGKASKRKLRWEIPARMVSATALVFLITGVAQILGPQLTGLLTPFPVYASILAIFTHKFDGGVQAVHLLKGVVAGSFTFAVFFLVISTTIVSWGIAPSFLCAMGLSLLTHTVSLQFLRRF